MPIEIREVVSKTIVDPQKGDAGGGGAAKAGGDKGEQSAEDLVDKVLKIFEEKEER